MNMVGLWVTVSLAVFSGLTMYSIYKNCDPLSNGDVGTSDQVSTPAFFALLVITRTLCIFLMQHSIMCNETWLISVKQLLPYLVMDILADYPGIPGLFVAAAYSGTLR